MPTDDREYYGPMSRGEIYEQRYGDLGGSGSPDLATDREHHAGSGKGGGADLASDRRGSETGEDAPTSQVAMNETDQATDEGQDDFRTPGPRASSKGDPAPSVRVSVPFRWVERERGARRPETDRDKLRAQRSGDEAQADPVRVSVGERLQLPPARFRTYGHAPPGLVSIGGRSAQSIDWSGADPYAGVPSSQVGPPGTPPPNQGQSERQNQFPPVSPQAPGPVAFRDPVHLAAHKLKTWLWSIFGPPEDVPPSARPR